jgi:spore germination protein YaaH
MEKKIIILIFLIITGASFLGGTLLHAEEKKGTMTSPTIAFTDFIRRYQKPTILGFLPYWQTSTSSPSDDTVLTDLAYFGLTINTDGSIKRYDAPGEEEPGVTTLKKESVQTRIRDAKKQGITTSLVIHLADEEHVASIAAAPIQVATTLASEVEPLMNRNNFQHLNMDIESFQAATPGGQLAMEVFFKTLRMLISPSIKISVDIAPISVIKPQLIDPFKIAPYVDQLIVMGYDFHYTGSTVTGPVAPIGGAGITRSIDISALVGELIRTVPKEKVILAIPLYGYEWESIIPASISATIPGSGKTASLKRIESDIKPACEAKKNCTEGWDESAKQPYMIIPEDTYFRVLYYENERSITEKIQYAKDAGLGGIAFWALGYEDSLFTKILSTYK